MEKITIEVFGLVVALLSCYAFGIYVGIITYKQMNKEKELIKRVDNLEKSLRKK